MSCINNSTNCRTGGIEGNMEAVTTTVGVANEVLSLVSLDREGEDEAEAEEEELDAFDAFGAVIADSALFTDFASAATCSRTLLNSLMLMIGVLRFAAAFCFVEISTFNNAIILSTMILMA